MGTTIGKLVNRIEGLKNDHRGVLFYVTMLGTVAYLTMLYYKFFSNAGTVIQPEFKGLYIALLSAYTTVTQTERMQGASCGYRKRPGEWLAACWAVSAIIFGFIHSIFLIGDASVLSEIVGMGPDYPIDWVLGLWGVNYAFRNQIIQKVGQMLANIPANGSKNGGPTTNPPTTPAS